MIFFCHHLKREAAERRRSSGHRRVVGNGERGVILLEVVLALVLFVAAAAIVAGGLNSSITSVDRQRLNTHAADLAASVLAELQIGVRSADEAGPEEFEAPFEDWTWEIVTVPAESGESGTGNLATVEVIVRHEDPAVVYRIGRVIRLERSRWEQELGGFGGSSPF